MIETLDDIVEQLADELGVYGAHNCGYLCNPPDHCCRVCWTAHIKERIRHALEVERKLSV